MTVFQDGRPAKKEYRRFSIKTVDGSNDFAMMREVISAFCVESLAER